MEHDIYIVVVDAVLIKLKKKNCEMNFNDNQCSEEKTPVEISNTLEPIAEPLIIIPEGNDLLQNFNLFHAN